MNATTWCLNQAGSVCEATSLDVVPSYENDIIRIELAGNEISKIKEVHLLTGDVKGST